MPDYAYILPEPEPEPATDPTLTLQPPAVQGIWSGYDYDKTFAHNLWDCQDLLEDPANHSGFITMIASAEKSCGHPAGDKKFDEHLAIPKGPKDSEFFFKVLLERSPSDFQEKYSVTTLFPCSTIKMRLEHIIFLQRLVERAGTAGTTRASIFQEMRVREPSLSLEQIKTKFRKLIAVTHPKFRLQFQRQAPTDQRPASGISRPPDHVGALRDVQNAQDPPGPETEDSNEASTSWSVPDGYTIVPGDRGRTVYRNSAGFDFVWNPDTELWE